MNRFIDINDRKLLLRLFCQLQPEAKPHWGKMTSQQMVEHLVVSVEYTNGKKTTTSGIAAEKALADKMRMVYTDWVIPKNVILEELPGINTFTGLPEAINQLKIELDQFDRYFEQPGATSIHPAFGPLNHHEWLLWHGKHFTHHLWQFGLWG